MLGQRMAWWTAAGAQPVPGLATFGGAAAGVPGA